MKNQTKAFLGCLMIFVAGCLLVEKIAMHDPYPVYHKYSTLVFWPCDWVPHPNLPEPAEEPEMS